MLCLFLIYCYVELSWCGYLYKLRSYCDFVHNGIFPYPDNAFCHRSIKMIVTKFYIHVYTLLYIIIHHAASFNILCGWGDKSDVAKDVLLIVYKGNKTNPVSSNTTADYPEAIAEYINSTKPSVVYIHGFQESSKAESVQSIVAAYLERDDVNIIVVDWGKLAINFDYGYVSKQVSPVGKVVAQSLEKLAGVIDFYTLHVIGHSLGAHVAGFIGKFMNNTLSRITGLDPAFPLFYPSSCHLTPKDAEIVSVLHTNDFFFGTPFNTGTIDFHANKGMQFQPGCPLINIIVCSHLRAVNIYAESVNNPTAFPARKCGETVTGTTNDNEVIYFGDSTPKNAYGVYCFQTNAQSPYGETVTV